MSGTLLQQIAEVEAEMARTQKNKATEYHIGRLKAKLAKLRTTLLEGPTKAGSEGTGFDVAKTGHARVALVGFPSVGKSTLLTKLTGTESVAASYEFTTLTCIPGNLFHKGCKIQVLDLPGIIDGASQGKGRGRQVIGVAKSSDLVLIVLDAAKELERNHRAILEAELEAVGLRLNRAPPAIYLKKQKTGGIKFSAMVPLTKLGEDPERAVDAILREYKLHNCECLFRDDCSADELIDVIEGNRKYVRVLYVWNKVDTVSIEDVDRLARQPHSVVCASGAGLNMDALVDKIWEYLDLTRVYTMRKGEAPDFAEPVVLTAGRHGTTVESLCNQIHRSLAIDHKYSIVWGTSAKHSPQHCGLAHLLHDEDVVRICKKTNAEQKAEKGYAARVQAHWE
jgi:small GTP-binding protein